MDGLSGLYTSKSTPLQELKFVPARKDDKVPIPEGINLIILNGGGGGNPAPEMARNAKNLNKAEASTSGRELFDSSQLKFEWQSIRNHKAGAGLRNLGNTCFLNSVLQCLTHTPTLAEHLLTCKDYKPTSNGVSALRGFQEHIRRAFHQRQMEPRHHIKTLRAINKSFRLGRQEDAHEYFIALLDSMHENLLEGFKTKPPFSVQSTSMIYSIFAGRIRSQVKCSECGYESNTIDPFLDISLEITRAHTLEQALQRFTAKEFLDGSNKYKCPRHSALVKAVKTMAIDKAPNVLCVHFKRFEYSMFGQKITKKVEFGTTLDLAPYMTDRRSPPILYDLYGVLVHQGFSVHSGHYYAFVKAPNGLWYQMNDDHVSQVSERVPLAQKAYILFYQRKGTPQAGGKRSAGPLAPSGSLPNGRPQPVPRLLDPASPRATLATTQTQALNSDLPHAERQKGGEGAKGDQMGSQREALEEARHRLKSERKRKRRMDAEEGLAEGSPRKSKRSSFPTEVETGVKERKEEEKEEERAMSVEPKDLQRKVPSTGRETGPSRGAFADTLRKEGSLESDSSLPSAILQRANGLSKHRRLSNASPNKLLNGKSWRKYQLLARNGSSSLRGVSPLVGTSPLRGNSPGTAGLPPIPPMTGFRPQNLPHSASTTNGKASRRERSPGESKPPLPPSQDLHANSRPENSARQKLPEESQVTDDKPASRPERPSPSGLAQDGGSLSAEAQPSSPLTRQAAAQILKSTDPSLVNELLGKNAVDGLVGPSGEAHWDSAEPVSAAVDSSALRSQPSGRPKGQLDEYDLEYDRGKTKKVKGIRNETWDNQRGNLFQMTFNKAKNRRRPLQEQKRMTKN